MRSRVVKTEVIQTKLRNPCATLQQIGNKYGITRERVRQILEPFDLPTSRDIRGKILRICPICGCEKAPNRRCCSLCAEKWHKDRYIQLACEVCGILYPRRAKELIYHINKRGYKHQFCGKKCQGVWLAKGYGFHRNHHHRKGFLKYDFDSIIGKHIETGYGTTRLSRLLNIPEGTISKYLAEYRKNKEK